VEEGRDNSRKIWNIALLTMREYCKKQIMISVATYALLFLWVFFPSEEALAQNGSENEKAERRNCLYTQFSLFMEENVHKTTNYRKGTLVPVNTEVVLVNQDDDDIELRMNDGTKLDLENIEPFSGEKTDGIFRRTLAAKKVDLSLFSDVEKRAIMSGEVEVGMSRAAVLVALGYPPKHKTPSLQGNQWRYWRNRFNTFVVLFEGDKVKAIKD